MSDLEEWRPVPGFEKTHAVSSHGRVRSVARVDPLGRARSDRLMKLIPGTGGYLRVTFNKPGQPTKTVSVHVLVASVFVGPKPSPDLEVRHLDGDQLNNRATNLRWGTGVENAQDRKLHGRDANSLKRTCPRGHRLEAPNLRANVQREGRRSCLACARARGYHNGLVTEPPEFQVVADAYYRQIMEEPGADIRGLLGRRPRLTSEERDMIRASDRPVAELARELGRSRQYIADVRSGRRGQRGVRSAARLRETQEASARP
jgi:hypothetical protein